MVTYEYYVCTMLCNTLKMRRRVAEIKVGDNLSIGLRVCLASVYRVMVHAGSLESTREA